MMRAFSDCCEETNTLSCSPLHPQPLMLCLLQDRFSLNICKMIEEVFPNYKHIGVRDNGSNNQSLMGKKKDFEQFCPFQDFPFIKEITIASQTLQECSRQSFPVTDKFIFPLKAYNLPFSLALPLTTYINLELFNDQFIHPQNREEICRHCKYQMDRQFKTQSSELGRW